MGCNCGKPKCDGKCGISPAVLQITNPSECVLFHKVTITSAMGNEITIPPAPGVYRNTLLYYEATGNAYFYSSDGIPTLITYTDYLRLLNKPSINGVTLVGNKTSEDLGIQSGGGPLAVYTIMVPNNIWTGLYEPDYDGGEGAVSLRFSEGIETPTIAIADENDNFVTPAEIEALGADNLDITFKLDVPYMDHISTGAGQVWTIPAFTGYFKMDSFTPKLIEENSWYMRGRCYSDGDGQYLIGIKTYKEDGSTSYDATLYVPNAQIQSNA